MKKFFLATMLMTLFTSLAIAKSVDKPVTSKVNYEVKEFSNLLIEGAFDVYLIYGLQSSVSIESSKIALDQILVDQEGDLLAIRSKNNGSISTEKIVLIITVNDLAQVSVKDVTSFETLNPMWFDTLLMYLDVHGKTTLNMIGSEFKLHTAGSGDVHLSGTISNVNVSNNGIGSITTEDLCIGRLIMTQGKQPSVEMNLKNSKGIIINKPASSIPVIRP